MIKLYSKITGLKFNQLEILLSDTIFNYSHIYWCYSIRATNRIQKTHKKSKSRAIINKFTYEYNIKKPLDLSGFQIKAPSY